ncbi:MAG: NADH-quinone oxidoreductase subunit H [bacterium]|nr:NADH-quinone oxidoreductase subunit H [bacterium]
MSPLWMAFLILVFPGFAFTFAFAMAFAWIDRKVTARVQWRVGPPFLQPIYDFVKLLGKEVIVPLGGAKVLFLLAPLLGLSAATLASTLVWQANLWPRPGRGFVGDLIVAVYLLTIPSLSVILGGFASNNRVASLGSSREMKMILSYELPFIVALIVPIVNAGGSIRLGEILLGQSAVSHPSGILAFIAAILCMQAKLGLVPFDAAEAETELMSGPFVEYSGAPLAAIRLTRSMMLFVMPVFLITVFWGGITTEGGVLSVIVGSLKVLLLLVIVILLRNTSPRIRIDQAIRFFWGPFVTGMAVLAVVLSLLGA